MIELKFRDAYNLEEVSTTLTQRITAYKRGTVVHWPYVNEETGRGDLGVTGEEKGPQTTASRDLKQKNERWCRPSLKPYAILDFCL